MSTNTARRAGARRMVESAALLVDEVLPRLPMRQWVLSFPFQLRFLFAFTLSWGNFYIDLYAGSRASVPPWVYGHMQEVSKP